MECGYLMGRYDLFAITILVILEWLGQLHSVAACPLHCVCEQKGCPDKFQSLCDAGNHTWIKVHCDVLNEDAIADLPYSTRSLAVSQTLSSGNVFLAIITELQDLRVLSINLGSDLNLVFSADVASEIVELNLTGGSLGIFPSISQGFPKLRSLNMSRNLLAGDLVLDLSLPNLEILDLSQNKITGLSLQGVFPSLHTLLVQGNILKTLPSFGVLPNLEVLNLAKNLINFDSRDDELTDFQDDEMMKNNPVCKASLPPYLKILILRGNLIRSIPGRYCGLLAGLLTLEELDLGYNLLRSLRDDKFPTAITSTLESLKLDGNNIYMIRPHAFSTFKRLSYLSLSNNRIRSIPVQLFESLHNQAFLISNKTKPVLRFEKNPISCDCEERRLLHFLRTGIENKSIDPDNSIICQYPTFLLGKSLVELKEIDLQCSDVVLLKTGNTTCKEYDRCDFSCQFFGLPHPQVHWISPDGETISTDSLAEDASLRSTYTLSQDGHQLSITTLRMHLTGIYKCIANNSLGTAESLAQVGLLPDPLGSIIAIGVSAVTFAIAIAVNCVNMCKCYCENLDMSKEDNEEEDEEEIKMESPLKSKLKGLHESEASLNANKYYRKYDFACQHIFLDAVIRGAHTVKQTLYDARNSEFSNNVWEYASHLRDRLHIDMPSSVQFPRVSMPSISLPSISMPTISMPTMPNLQSINTNIERLGTMVSSRSQNLATSVGSVFTRHWLRYGNSDNDSDSDVESASVEQVQVHVHQPRGDEQECSVESSPTMYSKSSLKKFIPKAVWSRKPNLSQCGTSRDSYVVPIEAKSVRFGDVETYRITRSSSCSELPLNVSNISPTVNEEDLIEPTDEDTVIDLPKLYQFETSV